MLRVWEVTYKTQMIVSLDELIVVEGGSSEPCVDAAGWGDMLQGTFDCVIGCGMASMCEF